MKVKVIIDDNIIIDEEVSDKLSNFIINGGNFKLEYLKSNGKDIDYTSKSNSQTNKNKRNKSNEDIDISDEELERLVSDLFVEEKPKPILIDEDEIDRIVEILEEKFKNQ